MATAIPLDPIRDLRALARRAALGQEIDREELVELLDALGPASQKIVFCRALLALAHGPEIDEEATRRRLFHAARALADRLDEERVEASGTFPIAPRAHLG